MTEKDCRIVLLTPSAVAHGRINLRSCGKEFFPSSAFGKPSKANGQGQPLRLSIKGVSRPVMTDIPTDTHGRPRWFFRDRAWVKSFVKVHQLGPGDKVRIRRISETEYELGPARPSTFTSLLFESPETRDQSQLAGPIDPLITRTTGRRGKNGDLNKLSPDDRPVHDWYRFVLSFPPHLVRDYLSRFGISQDACVLDPFCGTGTTIVECQKHGIPSIGVEANPMAFLATETKTDWSVDPQRMLDHAHAVADATLLELKAHGIDDNPILLRNYLRTAFLADNHP